MHFEKVSIQEKEYKLYKRSEYAPPGDYFKFNHVSKDLRNIYPFLACQNGKSDRFCWLLPEKPLILKNLFNQQVVYKLDNSLPVEKPRKGKYFLDL
jgi:hypothetical protein